MVPNKSKFTEQYWSEKPRQLLLSRRAIAKGIGAVCRIRFNAFQHNSGIVLPVISPRQLLSRRFKRSGGVLLLQVLLGGNKRYQFALFFDVVVFFEAAFLFHPKQLIHHTSDAKMSYYERCNVTRGSSPEFRSVPALRFCVQFGQFL